MSSKARFAPWKSSDRGEAPGITLYHLSPNTGVGLLYLTFRFSWAPHSTLQRGRQGGDSGAHLADGKSKKLAVLEQHSGLLSTSTPKPQTSVLLTRGKSFHLGNALPALGQARPGVQAVGHRGDKTGETGSALQKMLGLGAI